MKQRPAPQPLYSNFEDALFSDMVTHLYAVLGQRGRIEQVGEEFSCWHNVTKYFTWNSSVFKSHVNDYSVKINPPRAAHLSEIVRTFKK